MNEQIMGVSQLITLPAKELAELKEKAERWDALMSCDRIRVIGYAKLGDPKKQHMGVEFWSTYPNADDDSMSRHNFLEYIDAMRDQSEPEAPEVPTDPEERIKDLLNTVHKGQHDKTRGLYCPGWVVWCILIDAIKMYYRAHSFEPEVIYMPPIMEALIDDHLRQQSKGKWDNLRKRKAILGYPIVFDADAFRLDEG